MDRFVMASILFAAGCAAQSAVEPVGESLRVYWDSESKQPVAAALTAASPAPHPQTGRRTLMPALFCRKCNVWRAAPPLAELQRNPKARRCTQCTGPLVADGPLPELTDASPTP